MNKNYSFIFTGIFLAVCIALCAGIWYSLSELYSCREEYEMLSSERHTSTGVIANLEVRNASLSRISKLSINSAITVPDAVVFFSMVQQVLDNNGINLLNMTTSGRNDSDTKDSILQLRLDGNYYSMAKMLADLRELPAASKINHMSIRRNHNLPEELIQADLTLEVMTD